MQLMGHWTEMRKLLCGRRQWGRFQLHLSHSCAQVSVLMWMQRPWRLDRNEEATTPPPAGGQVCCASLSVVVAAVLWRDWLYALSFGGGDVPGW
jgi:hypothetical protein